MNVLGVIPARYASTRLEGKMLIDVCGKPLLQHTWENAKKAKVLDELIIATDDEHLKKVAEGFGAKVVLTAKEHASGTDRLLEACFSIDTKIVINIQGDEPLIKPVMVDLLGDCLLSDESVYMATMAKKIKDQAQIKDPSVVKVIKDRNGFALYFSRSVIPYMRNPENAVIFKHYGIYAYTKDFLFTFSRLQKSMLEAAESLEQLRVLENGYKIKILETQEEIIGVDTQQDLEKVREIITAKCEV